MCQIMRFLRFNQAVGKKLFESAKKDLPTLVSVTA